MNQENISGPFPSSGLIVFFRSMAGIGGGVIGSILLSIVFFIASAVGGVNFISSASGGSTHPLFVFVLAIIVLVGTVASNITSAIFISYAEPQKYSRIPSAVTQIFIINMTLFIFMMPIYILTYTVSMEYLKVITAAHALISVIASNMVLEIVSDFRYSLLEIYSTVSAIVFSMLFSVIFYFFNPTTLIFIAMPILWFCIGFFGGIVRMIYCIICNSYGIDALAVNTNYCNYEKSEKFFEEDEKSREEEDLEKIFEE